jgi:hypothetical protein
MNPRLHDVSGVRPGVPVETTATSPRSTSNDAQNVLTRRKLCWICVE